MKLINIGFGNMISAGRLIAIGIGVCSLTPPTAAAPARC